MLLPCLFALIFLNCSQKGYLWSGSLLRRGVFLPPRLTAAFGSFALWENFRTAGTLILCRFQVASRCIKLKSVGMSSRAGPTLRTQVWRLPPHIRPPHAVLHLHWNPWMLLHFLGVKRSRIFGAHRNDFQRAPCPPPCLRKDPDPHVVSW